MVKFWDNHQPLSASEQRLVDELYKAHAACVWRENCSTMALQQAAGGSRQLTNAYIAAMATLGEMHGPIEEAYKVILFTDFNGAFFPGWGNSFVKGQIDPDFLRVDQTIEAVSPRFHNRLCQVTDQLHARGKRIFPNPAAYTAATALILGMPSHVAPMLFVQARLEAWTELFHRVVVGEREKHKKAA